MNLLQGFHFSITMFLYIENSLDGCLRGGDCRHIRNLCLDGSFTEIAVIVNAVLAHWRVDDQINIAVGN